MEARRTAGLNSAPSCLWSPSPPPELEGAPAEALLANAGFVTFGNVEELFYFILFFLCPFSQCNRLPCVQQMQLSSLVM